MQVTLHIFYRSQLTRSQTIDIITDSDDSDTPVKSRPIAKRKELQFAVKKEGKPRATAAKARASDDLIDAATAEVIGLPEFARSRWATIFIPTIYHYAATRMGWDVWALGEDVKVIQHMVDTVWPGTSYKVKKGCPIYTTVCVRVLY